MSSRHAWTVAAGALLALGCSRGPKVEAGTSAPKVSQLAERYGCNGGVQTAGNTTRAPAVRPGTPMCQALDRFGNPVSVSTSSVAGMRMVSMLHRPNGRYVSVVYVYYEDTKQNRQLGRPIGRWIVQSVRDGR